MWNNESLGNPSIDIKINSQTCRGGYMKLETMIKSTIYVTQDMHHGMKVCLIRHNDNKLIMVKEGDDDKKGP